MLGLKLNRVSKRGPRRLHIVYGLAFGEDYFQGPSAFIDDALCILEIMHSLTHHVTYFYCHNFHISFGFSPAICKNNTEHVFIHDLLND